MSVMSPAVRKLALTAHVTASVGWLGAVAASLVLTVVGLASDDGRLVRAIYITMETLGWFVLVPLSVVSLVTGLVQALGTRWGLFHHYWVVFKLAMNLFATFVLLLYMETLGALARLARQGTGLAALRSPSPTAHSAAALVLLVTATVLSIYKPKGLTKFGQRKATALTAL